MRSRRGCCADLLGDLGGGDGAGGGGSGGATLLVRGVAANLLALAAVASLDDAHQVSVVALLLGLGTAGGRVGDVEAFLGHDLHTGEAGEVGSTHARGGAGGLGHAMLRGARGHRGGARGLALAPVPGAGGGGCVEGGGDRGGGRGGDGVDRVELEALAGHLGMLEEVESQSGALLLRGGRADEMSVY